MNAAQKREAHSIPAVLAALRDDTDDRSGWVRAGGRLVLPKEAFIAGLGWVRANGSYIRGGSTVRPLDTYPRWIDRWRIRRAMRAWTKRRHCHLEGHDAAPHQRTGTRRSDLWHAVAERVTQTRDQCTRCGEGLTPWEDVEDSVRPFTSYSAPAILHDRVMYGDGDWTTPTRVRRPA